MSTVLGLISVISLGLMILFSYRAGGQTKDRYGTTLLIAVIMAAVGFALGWVSRRKPDRYRFFPRLGMFLNGLTLAGTAFITYMAMR